ncbi:MAG: hypothetical protein JSR98_13195 [Proteobacteria bacterium]|nr:hypothetical protein [Pseudomonadota bacterium]
MISSRAVLPFVLAVVVTGVSGCAPAAITARSAQSDGVTFAYNLSPAAAPHHYQVSLALQDAHSGKAIDDAGVAVGLHGPGITEDNLVNLRHDQRAGAPVYVGDVALPEAATYRLTFQVNRKAPAASAQATFATARPAG